MLQVSRQCLALCLLVLAAIALLLLDQRSVTSYLTPAPSTCRKTLWLVVFGTRSHESFIKVAIMSALDRAPSLVPCVSFDGQFDTLPIWMRRLDAQGRILLVKHDLQMMSLLDPFPMQKHYYGCFYKVEIPLIYDKLLPRLHGRSDVNTNYLLYTDTDVVFFRDIDDCTIAVKPTIISVVQEAKYAVWRNKFWSNLVTETEHNSGVIYVNVPAMKRIQRGMVDFAIDTKFKYDNAGQAWDDELDQGLFNSYICHKLRGCSPDLPEEFNWRLWWPRHLLRRTRPFIAHLHMAKPIECVRCLLQLRHNSKECLNRPSCEGHGQIYSKFGMNGDEGRFYETVLLAYDKYSNATVYEG